MKQLEPITLAFHAVHVIEPEETGTSMRILLFNTDPSTVKKQTYNNEKSVSYNVALHFPKSKIVG